MNGVSLDACGECGALLAPGDGFDLHLQWHLRLAAPPAAAAKPESLWLTVPEFAAAAGFSHWRVYQLVRSDQIEYRRTGKSIRIPRHALETIQQETR